MTMTPGLRTFALTAHVTSSSGWLGAAAGFLALRRRIDQPGCNLT